MKCVIPEISWHNRDPVLSVDLQIKNESELFYRIASGGTDSHVLIWHVYFQEDGSIKLDCVCDLSRHHKAVNVVKFSPSGQLLASGDDESTIIIWKKKEVQDGDLFEDEDDQLCEERWVQDKVLRGHLNDIYDLSWSPDSSRLISGSVDNTAIIWDVVKGKKLVILDDHKNFVQGVAWDPLNEVVATMSSDSICRVFCLKTLKPVSRMSKKRWFSQAENEKPTRLFHDDTLKTFFRRLSFSPDGRLLIVPSGILESSGSKPKRVTWVFPRKHFSKPVLFYPTHGQSTTVVKCCPVLYTLREGEVPIFALPYRMVIAVATKSSILLYDTQHAVPIALINNIHYTKITDLAWSSDGRLLIASSTDGYCSLISFGKDELGTVYEPPPSVTIPSSDNQSSTPNVQNNKNNIANVKTPSSHSDISSSTCSTPVSSKFKTPVSKSSQISLFGKSVDTELQSSQNSKVDDEKLESHKKTVFDNAEDLGVTPIMPEVDNIEGMEPCADEKMEVDDDDLEQPKDVPPAKPEPANMNKTSPEEKTSCEKSGVPIKEDVSNNKPQVTSDAIIEIDDSNDAS